MEGREPEVVGEREAESIKESQSHLPTNWNGGISTAWMHAASTCPRIDRILVQPWNARAQGGNREKYTVPLTRARSEWHWKRWRVSSAIFYAFLTLGSLGLVSGSGGSVPPAASFPIDPAYCVGLCGSHGICMGDFVPPSQLPTSPLVINGLAFTGDTRCVCQSGWTSMGSLRNYFDGQSSFSVFTNASDWASDAPPYCNLQLTALYVLDGVWLVLAAVVTGYSAFKLVRSIKALRTTYSKKLLKPISERLAPEPNFTLQLISPQAAIMKDNPMLQSLMQAEKAIGGGSGIFDRRQMSLAIASMGGRREILNRETSERESRSTVAPLAVAGGDLPSGPVRLPSVSSFTAQSPMTPPQQPLSHPGTLVLMGGMGSFRSRTRAHQKPSFVTAAEKRDSSSSAVSQRRGTNAGSINMTQTMAKTPTRPGAVADLFLLPSGIASQPAFPATPSSEASVDFGLVLRALKDAPSPPAVPGYAGANAALPTPSRGSVGSRRLKTTILHKQHSRGENENEETKHKNERQTEGAGEEEEGEGEEEDDSAVAKEERTSVGIVSSAVADSHPSSRAIGRHLRPAASHSDPDPLTEAVEEKSVSKHLKAEDFDEEANATNEEGTDEIGTTELLTGIEQAQSTQNREFSGPTNPDPSKLTARMPPPPPAPQPPTLPAPPQSEETSFNCGIARANTLGDQSAADSASPQLAVSNLNSRRLLVAASPSDPNSIVDLAPRMATLTPNRLQQPPPPPPPSLSQQQSLPPSLSPNLHLARHVSMSPAGTIKENPPRTEVFASDNASVGLSTIPPPEHPPSTSLPLNGRGAEMETLGRQESTDNALECSADFHSSQSHSADFAMSLGSVVHVHRGREHFEMAASPTTEAEARGNASEEQQQKQTLRTTLQRTQQQPSAMSREPNHPSLSASVSPVEMFPQAVAVLPFAAKVTGENGPDSSTSSFPVDGSSLLFKHRHRSLQGADMIPNSSGGEYGALGQLSIMERSEMPTPVSDGAVQTEELQHKRAARVSFESSNSLIIPSPDPAISPSIRSAPVLVAGELSVARTGASRAASLTRPLTLGAGIVEGTSPPSRMLRLSPALAAMGMEHGSFRATKRNSGGRSSTLTLMPQAMGPQTSDGFAPQQRAQQQVQHSANGIGSPTSPSRSQRTFSIPASTLQSRKETNIHPVLGTPANIADKPAFLLGLNSQRLDKRRGADGPAVGSIHTVGSGTGGAAGSTLLNDTSMLEVLGTNVGVNPEAPLQATTGSLRSHEQNVAGGTGIVPSSVPSAAPPPMNSGVQIVRVNRLCCSWKFLLECFKHIAFQYSLGAMLIGGLQVAHVAVQIWELQTYSNLETGSGIPVLSSTGLSLIPISRFPPVIGSHVFLTASFVLSAVLFSLISHLFFGSHLKLAYSMLALRGAQQAGAARGRAEAANKQHPLPQNLRATRRMAERQGEKGGTREGTIEESQIMPKDTGTVEPAGGSVNAVAVSRSSNSLFFSALSPESEQRLFHVYMLFHFICTSVLLLLLIASATHPQTGKTIWICTFAGATILIANLAMCKRNKEQAGSPAPGMDSQFVAFFCLFFSFRWSPVSITFSISHGSLVSAGTTSLNLKQFAERKSVLYRLQVLLWSNRCTAFIGAGLTLLLTISQQVREESAYILPILGIQLLVIVIIRLWSLNWTIRGGATKGTAGQGATAAAVALDRRATMANPAAFAAALASAEVGREDRIQGLGSFRLLPNNQQRGSATLGSFKQDQTARQLQKQHDRKVSISESLSSVFG